MRSKRLRLHIAASRVHRWLALLVGIQLLLWFASGLVMSILPIERVRGEHLVDRDFATPIRPGPDFAPVTSLLRASAKPVREVSFRTLQGRAVAEIAFTDGRIELYDARSARKLPAIDANLARSIALSSWRGEATDKATVEAVTVPSSEYKAALPAWRVSLHDREATRVYVARDTGRITAVRTGAWRFYDFFWALHIMDWKNHEDFNTPWLIAFASGSLIFAIAGAVLLAMRWPRQLRRSAR